MWHRNLSMISRKMECTIQKKNIANPQFRKKKCRHSESKIHMSESLINKYGDHFFLKIIYQIIILLTQMDKGDKSY